MRKKLKTLKKREKLLIEDENYFNDVDLKKE